LSIVLLASEELSGGFLTQAVRGLIGARPYNGSLAYLNMAACVCAVMVWPVVSMMEGRPGRYVRFGAVVVLGATAAMLVRLDSLAAQLALGVGLVVFLVALYRGRMAYRGLRAAVVALMLFAPAWPHLLPSAETVMREIPNLTYSVAHRIVIWKFAADRIAEKPLTGWGLDSSRGFQKRYARPFPGKFAAANRDQRIAASLAYFDSQILPLHPHNGFLQIWLELGAVGALTVLGFLLWVLTAMERRCASRHARAGNAALFASGLVIFLTAFSSWQSWWQGALWLIAGLALAVVQPRSQDGGKTVP
jgi:O-antigen ligase